MSKDVSIVFKATDRMTQNILKMKEGVTGLEKDIANCRKEQERLSQQKGEVKLDVTKAKTALENLTKDVQKGVSGAEEAFKKQQMTVDNLQGTYKRLTQEQSRMFRKESKLEKEKQKNLEAINREYTQMEENTRRVAKAERQMQADRSRADNANAGRMGIDGLAKGLTTAGLGSMVGGAMTNYINATLTSTYGAATGNMIGSIGGGAISGAALGSIIPGIGTAIGAAVGGLTGAINALAEKQTKEDDIFRNEVQTLYNGAISDMDDRKTSGSAAAAEREMYQRNYTSMTDDETGARLYREIMAYGDKTPYDTSVMLGKGMEMLSYGVAKAQVPEMMNLIGNIAMGDTNKFSGLSYAISQSMNSGTLNGQDRRQMVGWGFDPLEYVAKSQGTTMSAAMDMMSQGKITSDMLVDALRLATSEGERFHEAVNATSDTFAGMQGQLESVQKNFDIAMGEGYNETRKQGMAKELETYTGELGDKMEEAYRMAGAYEAEMENRHQQMIIQAMETATKQIEEKGLKGIEAEKVMWEAKTNAEIEYKNSEEYQMKLQAEQDMVKNIQGSLIESGEYLEFGKTMGEQFSLGWSGAVRQGIQNGLSGEKATAAVQAYGNPGQRLWNHVTNVWKKSAVDHPHATGLDRVPYDGYEATLHEGERVLTRVEADKLDRKGDGVTIAKLADQIIVREEADIEKIARQIVRRCMAAAEVYA